MAPLSRAFRAAMEFLASPGVRSELLYSLRHRNAHVVFTAPAADGKIRLNLGCGDKLLPSYVNIDLAPSRSGRKPDLIADLRSLTFQSDSVDEILSVHVVEHFYYWDVEEILKEWRRVLKPGGRIIIECPNLLHAVRLLFRNPKYANDPQNGQMTMWVLYGDPSWKDPLMSHRWGYTPRSLGALLKKVGFSNVRREPAVFKRQHPRDMRITAMKPRQGR